MFQRTEAQHSAPCGCRASDDKVYESTCRAASLWRYRKHGTITYADGQTHFSSVSPLCLPWLGMGNPGSALRAMKVCLFEFPTCGEPEDTRKARTVVASRCPRSGGWPSDRLERLGPGYRTGSFSIKNTGGHPQARATLGKGDIRRIMCPHNDKFASN